MKYYNFSRRMYNSILSFYLELIQTDEIMSVPEIAKELEVNATTIRRFIDRIKDLSSVRCSEKEHEFYSKLYDQIMIHTKFLSQSNRYVEQQEIIERINKRKIIVSLVKQKTKEYKLKKELNR
ncbi:MAG: HTH domain-containing protein [Bacilli bacterium]|nr:HTH domain-containing protein [Bacilli bacterium]